MAKRIKREVPNTNNAKKTSKGNIYVMDFGWYDDIHKIMKLGQSVHTSVRAGQHKSKGNQFVRGKEPKIIMNCGVSKYSQDRLEDKNRDLWDKTPGFERCPGCRDTFFVDTTVVSEVFLTIRKTYKIAI